jgi:hypothetical protein
MPVALFLLVGSLFGTLLLAIGKLYVWPALTSFDASCTLPIGQLAISHPPFGKLFAWPAFTSGDASCTLPFGQLAFSGTLLLVNVLSGRSSPQVTPVAFFLLVSSLFLAPSYWLTL